MPAAPRHSAATDSAQKHLCICAVVGGVWRRNPHARDVVVTCSVAAMRSSIFDTTADRREFWLHVRLALEEGNATRRGREQWVPYLILEKKRAARTSFEWSHPRHNQASATAVARPPLTCRWQHDLWGKKGGGLRQLRSWMPASPRLFSLASGATDLPHCVRSVSSGPSSGCVWAIIALSRCRTYPLSHYPHSNGWI